MKRALPLHRYLLVPFFALTLALAGCSGDDGAMGPPGPAGPPGPGAPGVVGATGADSPNAALCYSCHQHEDDRNVVRGHINSMGGEMFGRAALGEDFNESCVACHGGLRPGGSRPTGMGGDLHAGAMHQAARIANPENAAITGVEVVDGEITVSFTIPGTTDEQARNVEFTIAKWVEAQGSWINLMQLRRTGGNAPVIRGGNLRVPVTRDDGVFTFTFTDDFRDAPIWAAENNLDPATYCSEGDTACEDFVADIIAKINADGAWDPNGTYRIGVSGRPTAGQDFIRFTAVRDFTLADGEVVGHTAPAATNQIAQQSCTSCHDSRLTFPRNDVHDQQRTQVAVCFNCHNDYTYDRDASVAAAGGWVNISMNNMIHKIHSGIDGYTVDGYAYEDVRYPDWTLPGTSNCSSCHIDDAAGFGEGWNRGGAGDVAGVAKSCQTCHAEGGYTFETASAQNHGAQFGFDCARCHQGAVRDGFNNTADQIHGVSDRLAALATQREDFHFHLLTVEDAVFEGTPVVRWQVLDAAGNPYHLADDITIHNGPRVQIGWGTKDDWTNEGSGEKSTQGARQNDDGGRPVVVNVATTGDNANTVISADGLTATTTFPAFTDAEAGNGHAFANLAAAEEGRRGFVAIHRRVTENGNIRLLTSLVQPIILGSGEVELADARRNTVNATTVDGRGGSCLTCHGTIAWHGSGYTADNNIQACITCHNAGSHKSVAVMDGEPPYSVDMMYLMHSIHSSPETLYPNDAAARCHACHTGNDNDAFGNAINVNSGPVTNCNLCHDGGINQGRLGVISDWPGAFERYGLRGDGTDGE